MNLACFLARHAALDAERPAIYVGDTVYARYGELAHRVARIARGLRHAFGLKPGEAVVLAMKNSPQFLESLYAVWHAGLAAVPVNAKLHAREIAYILDHCGARLCVADSELVDQISTGASAERRTEVIPATRAELDGLAAHDPLPLAERHAEDTAWVFYTSGTTGRPKGALLSNRNLLAMSLSYFADLDALDSRDRILHLASMSHGSGLYGIPFLLQGAGQIVPESGGVDTTEIYQILAQHRNVSFFAAPTMVRQLVAASTCEELGNLKAIIYGGGPMYTADCLEALRCFGPRLIQIYGQGESPMTITALSRAAHCDVGDESHDSRLGSVGVARSVVEVRIADADGNTLPPGATGEVLVRGDTVMAGYLNDPAASAAALAHGWLHTGDLGSFDPCGFLTLKDRSKDLIISGGSNIYPREVEEVLLLHPAVAEAAVVGRPDRQWGETVVAFVVCRAGEAPTVSEFDRLCRHRIGRFKRPRRYEFVAALPKNDNGKVLKSELRKRAASLTD